MQVDEGLLEPTSKQPCSLRRLAFVEQAMQRGVFVRSRLQPAHIVSQVSDIGSRTYLIIDQAKRSKCAGIKLHVLRKIMRFEGICVMV